MSYYTYIKESNYWMIRDFAINYKRRPEVQQNKLKALYHLIQKKGAPIQTEDEFLKGLKALEFGNGEYIAIKRTGSETSFYPCVMKTILLSANKDEKWL